MRKIIVAMVLIMLLSTSSFAFSNHVRWSFKADAPITSGIAANENYVFAGDGSGNCYAFNNSGSPVWVHRGNSSVTGTPVIANDRVVFVRSDGHVTCLKISDGSVIWDNNTPNNASGQDTAPDGAAIGDGKVFVSKGDGVLHALNLNDGKTVWTYKSEIELRAAPSFGEKLVFLGEYNGILSILNPKDGSRIGGGGAGGAINTLAIKNGTAYASSWDGSVQAFKIKDIIPLWNVKVGDPVTTQPEVNNGMIAVGTARGFVVALDEKSGNILWKFSSEAGNINAKPVIADGFVFAPTSKGIYVLDGNSGRERALIFAEEGGSDSSPAFVNDVLYVGCNSGAVYAVN